MRLGEQKQGKSEMIKYRACCKDRNARPGGNRKRLNQDCASLGIAICYDRYLKTLSARNKSRLISNLSTSVQPVLTRCLADSARICLLDGLRPRESSSQFAKVESFGRLADNQQLLIHFPTTTSIHHRRARSCDTRLHRRVYTHLRI